LIARHFGNHRNPKILDLTACLMLVIPAKAGIQPLMKDPCVYILASGWHGTLYVGVTSDLIKRVWQHKNDMVEGFTRHYKVHDLVWFEQHATMEAAIEREKAIKEWKRAWKIEMIETANPKWTDLYAAILG
jgi:putative endonuclease